MTGARPPSKRGACQWCGRTMALTLAGVLRRHLARPGIAGTVCLGSGQEPR